MPLLHQFKEVFHIRPKFQNPNLKPLAFSFLSGVLLIVLTYVFLIAVRHKNDWIIGDWLVNYEDGGFKRRGFSGSFFFLLQDLTKIRLDFLIGIVIASLYVTFAYFLYFFIRNVRIDLPLFSLFFSPLTFLFFLNDTATIGRKEIILFVIFSWYAYLIINNKLSTAMDVMIRVFLSLAILFHELIIFYVIFFPVLHLLIKNTINLRREFFLLLLPFFAVALLFFFGNVKLNGGESFHILHSRGIELDTQKSPLNWEEINVVDFIIANVKGDSWYAAFFLFGTLHFLYFAFLNFPERFRMIWKVYALCSLSVVPLFFLGIDWGRWINIHFMLWLIIFLTLKQYSSLDYKPGNYAALLFTSACILSLFVSMPHCENGIGPGIIVNITEVVARF